MPVRFVPVYQFSISRTSVGLRVLLLACSLLPLVPFVLLVLSHFLDDSLAATTVAMIVGAIFAIPSHEAMHGLIFWLYKRKVSFGFKPWTAFGPVFYAASIGSRFSRRQYQLACIAPQFLTVALTAIVALHFSGAVSAGAAYAAALMLGGGAVDVFVFIQLFSFPKESLVEDSSAGLDVYLRWRVSET